MPVTVRIPTPFQSYTDGREEVTAEPGTVLEILMGFEGPYPGLAARIIDGVKVRGFLHVFVNDREIGSLQAEQTLVGDGDEVLIIPAIAGGGAAVVRRTP
jgi:molybdopterin converting factor small subunit